MSIPDRFRDAAAREEERARELWDSLFSYVRPPLDDEAWRRQWESGLWRIALYEAGDYSDEVITLELVQQTPPDELGALLWEYLRVYTERADRSAFEERGLIRALPRGQRIAYTLTLLDSEISNGGLQQYFTNWSGLLAAEAQEDLERIGAVEAHRILAEAIRLNQELESRHDGYRRRFDATPQGCDVTEADAADSWADLEANVQPEFDRLDGEWYALADSPETSSPWKYFERYAKSHPDEFVHGPLTTT